MAKFTVGQNVVGKRDTRAWVMPVEASRVGKQAVIVDTGRLCDDVIYCLEYPDGAIDWADECTLEAV